MHFPEILTVDWTWSEGKDALHVVGDPRQVILEVDIDDTDCPAKDCGAEARLDATHPMAKRLPAFPKLARAALDALRELRQLRAGEPPGVPTTLAICALEDALEAATGKRF